MTFLAGMVLPSSWLGTAWYATLTGFVAVNTLIYVVLSLAKLAHPVHPGQWIYSLRTRRQRREDRSIHPPGVPLGGPPTR